MFEPSRPSWTQSSSSSAMSLRTLAMKSTGTFCVLTGAALSAVPESSSAFSVVVVATGLSPLLGGSCEVLGASARRISV